MKRRLDLADVPEIPGYSTVAAVGEKYGLSKGAIYNLVFSQLAFKFVYKITKGGSGDEKRPLIMLLDQEVDRYFADKQVVSVSDREIASKRVAWRKRVKDWGRQIGWDKTLIAVSGPPHTSLVAAYEAEHPDDRMPESD